MWQQVGIRWRCCARRSAYFILRILWRNHRPKRMYRRGRAPDQSFGPTEELYVRCTADECQSLGDKATIKPAALRVASQSFNRQRYSKIRDVLLPSPDIPKSRSWILAGVAVCAVKSVPAQVLDGTGAVCRFQVEHDPLDDNYSHTELRAYVNGERRLELSRKVKKECQTILALKLAVKIKPLV